MIGAAPGGILSLPRSFHALRHSLRAVTARTLIARARADLRLHFTKSTLHAASSVSSSSSSFSTAAAAAIANADALLGGVPNMPPLATVSIGSNSNSLGGMSYGGGGGCGTSGSPPPLQPLQQPRSSWGGGPPPQSPSMRRQKEDLIAEYVAHAQSSPPQAKHVSLVGRVGRSVG
jgi:hypothetical protein